MSVLFLHVPFIEKSQVKSLGGKWDPIRKKWFCFDTNKDIFNKWLEPPKKIYIISEYEEKNKVKKLGGKWDNKKRCWFGFESDKELFKAFDKNLENDNVL